MVTKKERTKKSMKTNTEESEEDKSENVWFGVLTCVLGDGERVINGEGAYFEILVGHTTVKDKPGLMLEST